MSPAVGTTLRRHRRLLLVAIAVILIVAITVVAVSFMGNEEPGPPTVTVDRGTVALAVSASGSIAPAGRQSLGFADGGTVTQVLVNVGDRVQPGQVLARIDDTVARQTLAQRQATLNQQIATLNKLLGGNTVEAAQASLDKAQDIERATRRQVDATNSAEPVRHRARPHAARLRQVGAGPGRGAARRRPDRVPGEPAGDDGHGHPHPGRGRADDRRDRRRHHRAHHGADGAHCADHRPHGPHGADHGADRADHGAHGADHRADGAHHRAHHRADGAGPGPGTRPDAGAARHRGAGRARGTRG